MHDLSIFEIIWIDRQAWADARNRRIDRIYFPDNEMQITNLRDQANNVGSMLFSHFISNELSKFSFDRDKSLYTKRRWGWSYLECGLRTLVRVAVPNRIATLNNRISHLRNLLDSKAAATTLELDKLNAKRRQHELYREYHMVQMCVNKADAIRAEYARKTEPIYLEIDKLVGQIIKVLEIEDKRLTALRSRRYRRVRRYCSTACKADITLGPEYLTDEMLQKITPMETLGEYTAVLSDAYQLQQRNKNEHEQVRDWK